MSDLIDWAIDLLSSIDVSDEKKAWCEHYLVYDTNHEQEKLEKQLAIFEDRCYEAGLVIANYDQVARFYGLSDRQLENPETASMTYLEVLCSITWHFRRDQFIEGALIGRSIASGVMLKLFKRLRELQAGPCVTTTLETLYRMNCVSVPKEKGIYRVLLPDKMDLVFKDQCQNRSALDYTVDRLQTKYDCCKDRRILYIGKANGRNGLQQRLRQYMKYGWNEAANHKGGRAIWQIENFEMLLLDYEPCADCEQKEHELLHKYKEENGCYPLANWRG